MLPTPCTATNQQLVRRVARRDEMGHHAPLTTLGRGIDDEQALAHGAVPVTICSVGGTRIKEKKDLAVRKPSSPWLFSIFLSV